MQFKNFNKAIIVAINFDYPVSTMAAENIAILHQA